MDGRRVCPGQLADAQASLVGRYSDLQALAPSERGHGYDDCFDGRCSSAHDGGALAPHDDICFMRFESQKDDVYLF